MASSKENTFLISVVGLAVLGLAVVSYTFGSQAGRTALRDVFSSELIPVFESGREQVGAARAHRRSALTEMVETRPSISHIMNESESKYKAYSKLLQRAESGHLDSIYAVKEIDDICSGAMAPEGFLVDIVPARVRERPEWKRSIEDLRTWCGPRTVLDERVAGAVEDLWLKIGVFSENGDKLARLYHVLQSSKTGPTLSHEDSRLALDILRSKPGGETVMRAASILVNSSDNHEIRNMDNALFGGSYTRDEMSTVKTAAVRLYACRHGRYCAPRGNYQRYGCLLHGWCNQNLSVPEYIRTYELSATEFRLAQQYASRLEDYIGG